MRKSLAGLLAMLLALGTPASLWAQSGGNCSIYRSWSTGDQFNAADITTSMTTVGVTNMTLDCLDGYSDSVANMQTTVNPFASDAESLATNARGEITRLRYVIQTFFGLTNWYRVDSNLDFASGSGIDGAGLGRHLTAVGLHTWSGSARFPAITSTLTHTTGIYFPAAHHLAISIDPAHDGDKAGVEMFRFHAQALTLHHTAALRFRHSLAEQGSTTHVTALELDGRTDQLIVGHAGSALRLRGAGITGGSDQVLAVAATGLLSTTANLSGLVAWGSRGQFSGTGFTADGGHVFTLRAHAVQLMNASTHAATVRTAPADINVNIGTLEAANGRDRAATLDASSWVHFYWIWDGSTLAGLASPDPPRIGPNLPSGYTHWSYAATVRLGALQGGVYGLIGTHMVGAMAYRHVQASMVAGSTATAETLVDAAAFVPPEATEMIVNVNIFNQTTGTPTLAIRIVSGLDLWRFNNVGGTAAPTWMQLRIPNLSQRFYVQSAGGTWNADINGYVLPNGGG